MYVYYCLNFLLLNENHMLPTVSLNKNNQIMIPSSDQLIKCVSTVQKSYLHTWQKKLKLTNIDEAVNRFNKIYLDIIFWISRSYNVCILLFKNKYNCNRTININL
jgi:hypothetical protein